MRRCAKRWSSLVRKLAICDVGPAAARERFSSPPFRLPDRPLESDILAKYFRGLGDATRVRILAALNGHERSVGELVALLDEPQPKVSNHLACLRWCGFVDSRREHRTVYYRIADPRVATIIELAHSLLEGNAEHVAAFRRIDGEAS